MLIFNLLSLGIWKEFVWEKIHFNAGGLIFFNWTSVYRISCMTYKCCVRIGWMGLVNITVTSILFRRFPRKLLPSQRRKSAEWVRMKINCLFFLIRTAYTHLFPPNFLLFSKWILHNYHLMIRNVCFCVWLQSLMPCRFGLYEKPLRIDLKCRT